VGATEAARVSADVYCAGGRRRTRTKEGCYGSPAPIMRRAECLEVFGPCLLGIHEDFGPWQDFGFPGEAFVLA
jgi:hypothetical protein